MNSRMTAPDARLDLGAISPATRQDAVLAAFGLLPLGGELQMVADHDPQDLYHALRGERVGDFDWHYLERGPSAWRVSVRKVGPAPAAGGCCGACGGGRH